MAEEKPPEGGTGAADTELAKLKADLEAARADALREKTEREKLESIRKEVEESRQAAKERERKALEEQGQFKAVAEMQAEELKKLKESIEAVTKEKSELEALKTEAEAWKAYQAERKKALLEQLPEDRREKFANAPLDLLEEAVSLVTGKSPGTFTGASSHKPSTSGAKWSEMDNATRAAKARELSQDELTKLIAGG